MAKLLITSMWGPVEEPLAADCAILLLSLLSVSLEDVKELLTHLITALAKLHVHHGHC